jgi:hypothetical protein
MRGRGLRITKEMKRIENKERKRVKMSKDIKGLRMSKKRKGV